MTDNRGYTPDSEPVAPIDPPPYAQSVLPLSELNSKWVGLGII